MPRFVADVSFGFESENINTGGADLRRLAEAAARAGFELQRGKVAQAPPDDNDESGWTSYAPLDADD